MNTVNLLPDEGHEKIKVIIIKIRALILIHFISFGLIKVAE